MKHQNSVLIYGASGHAKVLISIAESNKILVGGVFDDYCILNKIGPYPILGKYSNEILRETPIIIAIGDNNIRKKIIKDVLHEFAILIHNSTIIDNTVLIGKGTVVVHNSVIQRDSIIGNHCIINTNSSIDHDCILGDFVHISPSVTMCGNVQIGDGTHVGAGTIIIPNIKIGKWCVIAAGSVIIKDIPDYSLVVGVPGKIIKILNNE
jgi:sugar O-acyltransferase (sialic acid O-acetyltransferase NeuD family)